MSVDAAGAADEGTAGSADAGAGDSPDTGSPDRRPAVDEGTAGTGSGDGRRFDRSPTALSSRLALGAALAAVLAVGVVQPAGGAVGAVGLVAVAVGIGSASVGWVVAGALLVFAGVLVAGVLGASAVPLVVATLGALLTWDLGEQAITLGEQVGHEAATRRGELVHAGISVVVGGATGAVVLGLYSTVTGGFPVTALIVLLLAAAALASALRP